MMPHLPDAISQEVDAYLDNLRANAPLEAGVDDPLRQASIAAFNQITNHDAERADGGFPGTGYVDYQRLVGLLRAESPFMQRISDDLAQYYFVGEEGVGSEARTNAQMTFYLTHHRMIFQIGMTLIELIDTGRHTQLLIYAHDPDVPKKFGNKPKYCCVQSYHIDFTAQDLPLDEQERDRIVAEGARHWNHSWFPSIDDTIMGYGGDHVGPLFSSERNQVNLTQKIYWLKEILRIAAYPKDLKRSFQERSFHESRSSRNGSAKTRPSMKQQSLHALDVWITAPRSEKAGQRCWISNFQRFRAALAQLPHNEQRAYFPAPVEDLYPLTPDCRRLRLKAKIILELSHIAIGPIATSEIQADTHHRMLQNLLDAFFKLPDEQATALAIEHALLSQVNVWIVDHALPHYEAHRVLAPIDIAAVVQNYGQSPYQRLNIPYHTHKPRIIDMPQRAVQLSGIQEAERIILFDEWMFNTLVDWRSFLKHLEAEQDKRVKHYWLEQFASRISYDRPTDVPENNLPQLWAWFEVLEAIMVQTERILQDGEDGACSNADRRVLLEKFHNIIRLHLKAVLVQPILNIDSFIPGPSIKLCFDGIISPIIKKIARENSVIPFLPPPDILPPLFANLSETIRAEQAKKHNGLWRQELGLSFSVDFIAMADAYFSEQNIEVNYPDFIMDFASDSRVYMHDSRMNFTMLAEERCAAKLGFIFDAILHPEIFPNTGLQWLLDHCAAHATTLENLQAIVNFSYMLYKFQNKNVHSPHDIAVDGHLSKKFFYHLEHDNSNWSQLISMTVAKDQDFLSEDFLSTLRDISQSQGDSPIILKKENLLIGSSVCIYGYRGDGWSISPRFSYEEVGLSRPRWREIVFTSNASVNNYESSSQHQSIQLNGNSFFVTQRNCCTIELQWEISQWHRGVSMLENTLNFGSRLPDRWSANSVSHAKSAKIRNEIDPFNERYVPTDPRVRRWLSMPLNISPNADFESIDLMQMRYLSENSSVNDVILDLTKMLRRGRQEVTVGWSQGILVLDRLLLHLGHAPSEILHLAYSLIAQDYTEVGVSERLSRQKVVLKLVGKSDASLSLPEIDPYYFTYASVLQLLLIQFGPEAPTDWCDASLARHCANALECSIRDPKRYRNEIRAACTYQCLDIYRRQVINGDFSRLSEDYKFFVEHLPNNFFEEQEARQNFHPDIKHIFISLQSHWMRQWNIPKHQEAMRAVLLRLDKDPGTFDVFSNEVHISTDAMVSVLPTGAQNVPTYLLPLQNYLNYKKIKYLERHCGIINIEADGFFIRIHVMSNQIFLMHQGSAYQYIPNDRFGHALGYYSGQAYSIFVETDSQAMLVLKEDTLDMAFYNSPGKTQFHKPDRDVAYSFQAASSWNDCPEVFSLLDPTNLEVCFHNDIVESITCLKSGLVFNLREDGLWCCADYPTLICQMVDLPFKAKVLTNTFGLFNAEGQLQKVIIPCASEGWHHRGTKAVVFSVLDYRDGKLEGHTTQEKCHALYLYMLDGTNAERYAAFHSVIESGALNLDDPLIQYQLFLMVFRVSEKTPEILVIKIRLMLQIFARRQYADAEISLASLLSMSFIYSDIAEDIAMEFTLSNIIIEFSKVLRDYYGVERNLPYNERLLDHEKQHIARLIGDKYKNALPQQTIGQALPGPVVLAEAIEVDSLFPHFQEILALEEMPEIEAAPVRDVPFLQRLQESDALVAGQQAAASRILFVLNRDSAVIEAILEKAKERCLETQAAKENARVAIEHTWAALQTSLGKSVSVGAPKARHNPRFEVNVVIRALFFGELTALEAHASEAVQTQARALKPLLADFMFQSILLSRTHDLVKACAAENGKKIADILMEQQDPLLFQDLRLLVIAYRLGFFLRHRQIIAIQNAVQTRAAPQVLEAEMGFGKSEVILPAIALMIVSATPLLVLPSQLLGLIETAVSKTTGFFGYTVNRIQYSREQGRNIEYFQALLLLFQNARAERQLLVTDQSSMEALELSYIEKCLSNEHECVKILARILVYKNQSLQVNQDEFHEQTVDRQFNYATGIKVDIPKGMRDAICDLYYMITQIPQLKIYLDNPDLLTDKINQTKFKNWMFALCFQNVLSPLVGIGLTEAQQLTLMDWFRGNIDEPDFLAAWRADPVEKTKWEVLHASKYFIQLIAITALQKKPQETYGRNPREGNKPSSLVAIPYKFKDEPCIGSEYVDPVQLAALSAQLVFSQDIPSDVFMYYCAQKQAYYKQRRIHGATESQLRRDPLLHVVMEARLLPDALMVSIENVVHWNEVWEAHKQDVRFKRSLLKEEVLPSIHIHNAFLKHTHSDFLMQSGQQHLLSGTPPHATLPLGGRPDPEISLGVSLRVASILLRQNSQIFCAPVDCLALQGYFDNIQGVIADKLDRFRIIFDLDNYFSTTSSVETARYIREWIVSQSNSQLNNIKAVVFFEGDKAYYLRTDAQHVVQHAIADIKNIEEELQLTDMNEIFIFFGQAHCLGVNMKLAPKVLAVANMGPSVPISKYLQTVYRLRELEGEQRVITITDRQKQALINATAPPTGWAGSEGCDLILVPISEEIDLQSAVFQSTLRDIARTHGDNPLLLKQGTAVYIYGAAPNWGITELEENAALSIFAAPIEIEGISIAIRKCITPIMRENLSMYHYRSDACLHGANAELVRVLLHAYQVFENIERRSAPVMAQQRMHAYLRSDILKRSYAANRHWKLIKENADIFTVKVDFHDVVAAGNLRTAEEARAVFFDHLVDRYQALCVDSLDLAVPVIRAQLQAIRAQYEGESLALIPMQSSTADASAQAQQQVESQVERQMEMYQMRQMQSAPLSSLLWNEFVIDYFENMERWCTKYRFGLERITGNGFFPVNDFYLDFRFDSNILVTGNHKHWMALPWSLFTSSYQEVDFNKPFDIAMLFQYRGEMYTLVCTTEDARYIAAHRDQITLPFVLYRSSNSLILQTNSQGDADVWCGYLTEEEPDADWLANLDYQRIHGMRQQLKALNGELASLLQEEDRWFFLNTQDPSAIDAFWNGYQREIAPVHLGQTPVVEESYRAAVTARQAQPVHVPEIYHHQSRTGWGRSVRLFIQSIVSRFVHWVFNFLQQAYSAIVGWFDRLLNPPADADRYTAPERYLEAVHPEGLLLLRSLEHRPMVENMPIVSENVRQAHQPMPVVPGHSRPISNARQSSPLPSLDRSIVNASPIYEEDVVESISLDATLKGNSTDTRGCSRSL